MRPKDGYCACSFCRESRKPPRCERAFRGAFNLPRGRFSGRRRGKRSADLAPKVARPFGSFCACFHRFFVQKETSDGGESRPTSWTRHFLPRRVCLAYAREGAIVQGRSGRSCPLLLLCARHSVWICREFVCAVRWGLPSATAGIQRGVVPAVAFPLLGEHLAGAEEVSEVRPVVARPGKPVLQGRAVQPDFAEELPSCRLVLLLHPAYGLGLEVRQAETSCLYWECPLLWQTAELRSH